MEFLRRRSGTKFLDDSLKLLNTLSLRSGLVDNLSLDISSPGLKSLDGLGGMLLESIQLCDGLCVASRGWLSRQNPHAQATV